MRADFVEHGRHMETDFEDLYDHTGEESEA